MVLLASRPRARQLRLLSPTRLVAVHLLHRPCLALVLLAWLPRGRIAKLTLTQARASHSAARAAEWAAFADGSRQGAVRENLRCSRVALLARAFALGPASATVSSADRAWCRRDIPHISALLPMATTLIAASRPPLTQLSDWPSECSTMPVADPFRTRRRCPIRIQSRACSDDCRD